MRKWYIVITILLIVFLVACKSDLSKEQGIQETGNEQVNEVALETPIIEHVENIVELARFDQHKDKIWTLDANETGQLASGSKDTDIIVWDIKTLEATQVNSDHTRLVEELYYIGDMIFSIGDDGRLLMMNAITGKSEVLYEGKTTEMALSKDKQLIGISDNKYISIFNMNDFSEMDKFELVDGCFDMRFSNDGKSIYIASHNGKVQKLNVKTGELIFNYEGISADVHTLELTDDEKYVVAGSTDRSVVIWDTNSGEIISRYYHNDGVNDVDITKDGSTIVSVGADKVLNIVDLQSGKILKRITHEDELLATTIDPFGRYIVTGGYSGIVYVWGFEELDTSVFEIINLNNAQMVEKITEFKNHTYDVFDVALSKDNTLMTSAERNMEDNAEWVAKVNVWDVSKQSVISILPLSKHQLI